jgi:RNA polymerase sigma factor (sigma-70 family)
MLVDAISGIHQRTTRAGEGLNLPAAFNGDIPRFLGNGDRPQTDTGDARNVRNPVGAHLMSRHMNSHTQQAVFDAWLREHAAILHHVVNGFATGADRHDLMQELLLALWRAVPAFREASRASTFIFRVTHNAALGWKRSEKGYRRRQEDVQRMGAALVEEATPAPATVESPDDQLELLYAAIRQLEPLDRSLVMLQLDGASYGQISEIHGLSETNVGVRLNRIKQKLATIIQEKSS